ncbi:MAG: radical SAM protein, partial [Lentisphaerota bacterium]
MKNNIDILFVYPNNRHRAYGELMTEIAAITPPVEAGLLAAYAREKGERVGLLDADQRSLTAAESAKTAIDLRPGLICLCTDFVNSGDVTKVGAALDTLKEIKKLDAEVPVLLQGIVPSAYPEKMLREEKADYVCQGEGYQPLVELSRLLRERGPHPDVSGIRGIWTLRDGALISSCRCELVDPNELPMTAWDLMPPTLYRAHHWHCFDRLDRRSPYACVYTNFGCPYSCTFCSVNVVAGRPNLRFRSPEKVMEEIDWLVSQYGVSNIRILDNVFTIRPDFVERLCNLIIARGHRLNLWAYARVETIKSQELLFKMKKAGVNWLAYGFEAASDRVKKAIEKQSSQQAIDRAIEWTQNAGIHIVGNFIFGLPEDDFETMRMSLDMAKKYNFEFANFYCAMAYPGTALYDQALKDGVDLPATWSGFGQYSADSKP